MTPITTLRPAHRSDATQLAWFLNEAGDGIALEFWESLASHGQNPWHVGCERILLDEGDNSWRNWTVAERAGRVAGGLCCYEISQELQTVDADTPLNFVPMIELENLARGTFHIHVLATSEQHRRLGIGRSLLMHAQVEASQRMQSIIVDSTNEPACALYLLVGFNETARRPILDQEGRETGGDWRLLVK